MAMGRPPQFDRVVARDRALMLFWRKGYQATSLADLLAAMEISRSSFYGAFGDKRALFVECLDLFAERTLGFLASAPTAPRPLEVLRRFFELGLDRAGVADLRWGCLLVNTSLEMAGVDDDLSARASGHLGRVQGCFELSLIQAGRPPERAADLAAFLMLLLEGLRVSSRRALPSEAQRHQIHTAFQLIEATP